MPINARTFQVLYIIRSLVQDDKLSTAGDISDFIAARRKSGPDSYSKAYISPGNLLQMLNRMSVQEGLLDFYRSDNTFHFTVTGSLMADLLCDVDACSTHFINRYKEEVCLAVLDQRQRLDQPPATPRDIAVTSNISLDSTRRGLMSLCENGRAVEDNSSRTPTYTRAGSSTQESNVNDDGAVLTGDDPSRAAGDDVALLLEGIDDEPMVPGDTPMTAPDDEDNIIPLSLVLGDDDDDELQATDAENKAEVLSWDSMIESADDSELLKANPYAWVNVEDYVRNDVVSQAQACGLSLNLFLETIVEANKSRMRVALRHTI